MQRLEERAEYVYNCAEPGQFHQFFNYDFGCGEIKPVYIAHLETLLPAWRHTLKEKGLLLEEEFELSEATISPRRIQYKNIIADKIIFCDGISSASSTHFNLLPFAPNKGELLIVEIPDLSPHYIYKKSMMLVPLALPGQWWIGSNYAWEFEDPAPTALFRERTEQLLHDWLKITFRITAHLAGIRPATLERRPFVGFHPLHPNIGILNGMGTKGCSLAPFFAKQLVDHLCHDTPLNPEADIRRFQKILTRKIS